MKLYLFLELLLLSLSSIFCQSKFTKLVTYQNLEVNEQYHGKFRIEQPSKLADPIFCSLKCVNNPSCQLATYNSLTSTCMLFNHKTQFFDTKPERDTTIYSKNKLGYNCPAGFYPNMTSSTCIPQKHFNETCTQSVECSSTNEFMCVNGHCNCNPNESDWSVALKRCDCSSTICDKRKDFGSKCSNVPYECAEPLICYYSKYPIEYVSSYSYRYQCKCPHTHYWYLNACVMKKDFNASCNSTLRETECRHGDCTNDKCSCISSRRYFNSTDKCSPPATYGSFCENDEQCDSILVCHNSTCLCQNITLGYSSYLIECVARAKSEEFCMSSNECIKGLGCVDNKCRCLKTSTGEKYWSTIQKRCLYEKATYSTILPLAADFQKLRNLTGFHSSRFSLLYRGTWHNFSTDAHLSKFAYYSKTLLLVKTTENYIFGGYTEATNSPGLILDPKAFIFTLVNPGNQPLKLNPKQGLFQLYKNILTFGPNDIKIMPNSNANSNSSLEISNYELPPGYSRFFFTGQHRFQTLEVEIFKVDFDSETFSTREDKDKLLKVCRLDNNFLDLAYRGTRDGFMAKDFHSRLDGVHNTIVAIKTDRNYVMGGYTEAAWSSITSHVTDEFAFLYIFKDRYGGYSYLRNINSERAIVNSESHGPHFGLDIQIANNSVLNPSKMNFKTDYYCSKSGTDATSYYFQTGNLEFLVKEIEIFKVIPSLMKFESQILNDKEQLDLLKLTGLGSRRFKLIYRMTQNSERFYERAIGVSHTLSIIRVEGGFVVGGYSNAAWTSGYAADSGAFLYTLKNPSNNSTKMPIKNGFEQYAINNKVPSYYSSSYYGPWYGIQDLKVEPYYSRLRYSAEYYHTPFDLTLTEARIFMFGKYNMYYTVNEVEVYQTFEN